MSECLQRYRWIAKTKEVCVMLLEAVNNISMLSKNSFFILAEYDLSSGTRKRKEINTLSVLKVTNYLQDLVF